jgi:fatty-acyl-CoA synthase
MAVAAYCDADSWCGLGDLGRIDASGYVFVNGRLDTMVNTGYHVYPEEVEEALLGLPGVAAARVIGQPDERRGQILAAYVVAEPDTALEPEALRAALRGRLATYKVPRAIWLVAALEQIERTKQSEVSR